MLFGEKQFMVCEERDFCLVLFLLASDLFQKSCCHLSFARFSVCF